MNRVQLVVGDWSDDGHGKTKTVTIEHNLSEDGLERAYEKGSISLGVIRPERKWDRTKKFDEPGYSWVEMNPTDDVMQYVAQEYEDSSVPHDIANALILAGIYPSYVETADSVSEPVSYLPDGETYTSNGGDEYQVEWVDGFVNLWMAIAKLGNSNLVWSIVHPKEITIGGYGLFH